MVGKTQPRSAGRSQAQSGTPSNSDVGEVIFESPEMGILTGPVIQASYRK